MTTLQADENHAWTAIELSNVADAYVRGVACAHLGFSCVHARSSSKAVTVENCTSVAPVSLICTPPPQPPLPPNCRPSDLQTRRVLLAPRI